MPQKLIFGLPVDSDVMFSNHKNKYKKRAEKRQRALIVKATFIKPFLEDGENILLIARGYSLFNTLEIFLMGWIFIWLKRSLFVFTDRRIFHIPTNMNFSYRNSVSQIPYSGCRAIQIKWGSLLIECPVCNHKDKYFGISRQERKKLKEIFGTVNFGGNTLEDTKRAHLCPRCTQKLENGEYVCENCSIQFKNIGKARIFSIFLPGGGYFYTRHMFLGIMNALLEISLIAGGGFFYFGLLI